MSKIKDVLSAASASARGVEENSSSRFVDYTMATSWETLSSEIEQAIKKWNSISNNDNNNNINNIHEIEYLGCKFNLLYYNKNNLNHDIYSWFGIKKFILLSKHSEWSGGTGTHSERHTLFSALVNGLTSSGVIDIPVFFCPTTAKKINNATDVLGYHIKNLNSTLHPCLQLENEISYSSIIQYESHIIDGIDTNHNFFYLDGLKQLFFEKLGLFSLYSINTNNLHLHFCVTEYFQYVNEKSRINPEFKHFNNNLKYSLEFNERFDPYLIDSRKYYGSVISDAKLCQIAQMTVKLQYPVLSQNSVIDNRQYTTLIPSKQASMCWSIKVSFNNHLTPLLENEEEEEEEEEINILNNESYSKKVTPLSHCLRRLLAVYILGKCGGKGSTPINLNKKKSSHNNINDLFDVNQAKSFTSLLSGESRQTVENVLDKNKLGYYDENESENEEIYEEKQRFELFFSYLFEKGLNNEEFNSNESIKQEHTNKWLNEDKIFNLVEMGSWVSRFGIFMGNLNGGAFLMLDFWCICLQEFRNRWETSSLIPHLESLYLKNESDNKPMWLDVLWQDLIEKKIIDSGIYIQLPDKNQLLLVQKLQMLQLCIAFKNEDTVCKAPNRKQDVTVFFPESSIQEDETLAKIERVKKIVKSPLLQRRLPMTQDAEAQHLHISQKLSSGNSRSGVENPLLRWQVELPALISDIKSFKAENLSADFETFKEWYFDGIINWSDIPIDMANLNIVWDSCTPVHASQQKPMFRAETEGEKVLGMLENLSITELASELLSASVISVYNFLSFELYEWCSKDKENIANNSIIQDLFSLQQNIKEVLHHISIDSTRNNMDEEESILSSQNLLVLMDGIIIQTAQLEEFIGRAKQLSLLIPISLDNEGLSNRLIISLCKNKEFKAENEEEGKYIFSLAKKISRGYDSHNWHSFDGRELGLPITKIFDLTCTSKLKFTKESSSFSLSNSNLEPQVEHAMNVNINNGRLRASFSCVEIDFE